MARYRKIDPRIWNDAKFSSFSSEAKLLFMYLLTAPAMTMIGAIPMRASSVAAELGLDSKRYAIRYRELYDVGIVEYDERGLFWVKNFLKYNPPDNPKVVLSWRNSIDLLPECPLLSKVLESAKTHCFQRGEGYAEAFRNRSRSRNRNILMMLRIIRPFLPKTTLSKAQLRKFLNLKNHFRFHTKKSSISTTGCVPPDVWRV